MMVPVRCFTCGKVVGNSYEEYAKRVEKGEKPEEVLTSLGIERYCCRRMILSHKDLVKQIMQYKT